MGSLSPYLRYVEMPRTMTNPFSPLRRAANARILVDRDKMHMASKTQVANATVLLFDRIQSLPKAIQLLALAGAFVLAADACKVPAQDVFTAVTNLMADPQTSTGLDKRFDAMRFHLREEVLSDS